MSEAAFAEIAKRKSDIVPVQYRRNWGQNWHCNVNLQQQPLSFEVNIKSGKTIASYNVATANWQFGQTFEGIHF
ncbi:unnamed protein product [Trifolium pratense]|uniref:Uncharacterized protein n=1 Tax=Trifolium pratense TaxID=57577 RepID=A0ACB0KV21_TRIPR|nr:unnamed protein product [Trifolium pratense]